MALLFDQNQGSFQDTGSQNSPVKKNTGMMRKEMSKLDSVAPRGHALAYITPEEAQVLNKGGGGVAQDGNQMMGPNGIPMYPGYDHRQRKTSFASNPSSAGPPGRNYSSSNDRNTGNNKTQKETKQERPKDMPSMLSYTPPKKKFNTDEFMETVGKTIGGNKDTINQGLLVDPNLNKTIEDKEKGNGILDRKGDVSNDIIKFLKTNIPETKKEQDELLFVVDKFPMLVKNNIKKAVDNNEISLVSKPNFNKFKKHYSDLVVDGNSEIKIPELWKKNSLLASVKPFIPQSLLSESYAEDGINIGTGRLADELAMAEGYERGTGGVRDALRHTMGAGYVSQGQGSITKSITSLFYKNRNQTLNTKGMNAWYTEGGPDYKTIVSTLNNPIVDYNNTTGNVLEDESKMADAHNNTLGNSGIFNGMSFEERYEKIKNMINEQLEHYSETGEFKEGLPVWATQGEFSTTKEEAKKQLETLENAKENLIESRRMGLLSQNNRREMSNLEQIAFQQREYRRKDNEAELKEFKEAIEKNQDVILGLEDKIYRGIISEELGRKSIKNEEFVLNNNLSYLNSLLKDAQKKGGFSRLKTDTEENFFDLVMEEQNFLKAGNDWVLNNN